MNRDEILRRFEEWLDGALAVEDPPNGIDAEILSALASNGVEATSEPDRPPDSYALWAATTALTQEVKLQSRAFKELNNTLGSTLGSQASRVTEEIAAVSRERERELQREAERRCQRKMLGVLIDLRDRLDRGLESVRAIEAEIVKSRSRPWLARVFGKPGNDAASEKLAALTRGYELGLDHLDQTLGELNVHRIRCEGQPFDPRRMNAIEKEESNAVPESTVLEVYRSGYEWNGEVFRPAQVKVSCAPVAGNEHE